ncbi:MAG: PrsW family glutamic-type intramembrane protease [Bacteroidota bacterium]
MTLLFLSLAPVILILIYINYRDKYEKEPLGLLLKALVAGAIITIPVVFVERSLDVYKMDDKLVDAFYKGFIVAALTEEAFKFFAFRILIWKNKNFNEFFDGIIYAVFISLGFAAVENILYVFQGGGTVGILRAFTAVPGHAIFGVAMGYYFALARFIPEKKSYYMSMAIIIPVLLHGFYDFIIFAENEWLLLLFVPYIIFMWVFGFKKMKKLSENSQFKG